MAIEHESRKLKVYTLTSENKKRTHSVSGVDPEATEVNMAKVVNAIADVSGEEYAGAAYEDVFEMSDDD